MCIRDSGEGEVVRPEPHDGILAVQALDDRFQAALEVAHGDALDVYKRQV